MGGLGEFPVRLVRRSTSDAFYMAPMEFDRIFPCDLLGLNWSPIRGTYLSEKTVYLSISSIKTRLTKIQKIRVSILTYWR